MRINKYIAQAGICSRRKADRLVESGKVKINGVVMKEPGYDVSENDKVEVNGAEAGKREKKVYYLLNKPTGFLTSVGDRRERDTVMDLTEDIEERVFPVGRLDYNTSGILIMTNDGDFAQRISHPGFGVTKTYRALIAGTLSDEKLAKLRNGVDIGGFVTSKAVVQIIKERPHSAIVDITIHEGKNREVRKMFAAVGNYVQELKRTAIGEVRLGRLKEGCYRKLTKKEIEYLKNC